MIKESAPRPEEDEPGDDLQPVLEAMLFAAHEPLTARRVANCLAGIGLPRIRDELERLQVSLDERRSPLQLVELAGGFRLVTRPEYAPYLSRLFHKSEKDRLSSAALETLAIIAYRQPVTRADIEGIRGVQAGPVLRALQERKLVKVVGRAPVVGRPQQFGTTRRFLDHFGLASLEQLPALFGDETLPRTITEPLHHPDLESDPDALEDPLEQAEDEIPASDQEAAYGEPEEPEAAHSEVVHSAAVEVGADVDGDAADHEVVSLDAPKDECGDGTAHDPGRS